MDSTVTGDVRLLPAASLALLRAPRDVVIYLPPGYEESGDTRFPVLYLHDGQNLFDAATAFAHNEWGLDELAEELIASGQIEPLIIVGIYNAGLERVTEYTHVKDRRGRGGRAREYGAMLVEDLKPFIDRAYRTLPDPAHTGLGGSSLGGLVTLFLGLQYPEVFGKLIVMSPSLWWANNSILKRVGRARWRMKPKIWLDIGTCEGQSPEDCVRNTAQLCATLVGKGWQLDNNLAYVEDEGAGHDEKAWGARMRQALTFQFPSSQRQRQ